MRNLLHPDFWVEIPAGDFLTGLAYHQRSAIVARLLQQVGYPARSEAERDLLQSAADKLRQLPRDWLSHEEAQAFGLSEEVPGRMMAVEDSLFSAPALEAVYLERFYIARYPLTERQMIFFENGKRAAALPGCLEEPETRWVGEGLQKRLIGGRWVAPLRTEVAVRMCLDLGARIPTALEWEKAARGTDGRLYPWGDDWNPEAGFFYYGQKHDSMRASPGRTVTGYPSGISPYGVAFMAGGLPEIVRVDTPRRETTRRVNWDGQGLFVDIKGCQAKESSEELAWFDHILAMPGRGSWVSLRPVLDHWPQTQWRGVEIGEVRPAWETSISLLRVR